MEKSGNQLYKTEKRTSASQAGGSLLGTIEHHKDVPAIYSNNSRIGKNCEQPIFEPEKLASDAVNSDATLGNTTNKVSTHGKPGGKPGKYNQYELQNTIKKLLAGDAGKPIRDGNSESHVWRVHSCMKPYAQDVSVKSTGEHFHFDGIMACGSVWLCPVCSPRIAQERRRELENASKRKNFFPVMATATLQHERGDALSHLLQVLNESLKKMKSGRAWQEFKKKYGIVAHVSALENRYSKKAGWHPHKHIVFFLEKPVNMQEFKREIVAIYTKQVEKSGGYASEFHSMDVQEGSDAFEHYITKDELPYELLGEIYKTSNYSYSPWELAVMAGEGDEQARMLYLEYAKATHGKKQFVYSHGGKKVLGIDEKTDEQLVNEQPESVEITRIPRASWLVVLREEKQAVVLRIAEQGGKNQVDAYVFYLVKQYRQRWHQVEPGVNSTS